MSKIFYIVAGDYRGGTTAVAQLMVRAGVDMGENMDPNNNQEDKDFQDIFVKVLTEKITSLEFNGEFENLVKARALKDKPCGFKFPGSTIFMPQIFNYTNRHFDKTKVILVFRDPVAVAMSEHNRTNSKPQDVLNIMWRATETHKAMINLINTNRGEVEIVPLSYEQLMLRKDEHVDDLIDFLEIPVPSMNRKVMIESLKLVKDKTSFGYEETKKEPDAKKV